MFIDLPHIRRMADLNPMAVTRLERQRADRLDDE